MFGTLESELQTSPRASYLKRRESSHEPRSNSLESVIMVKFFAALVSLVAVIEAARALPVERFTGSIDLACSPDDVCSRYARGSGSLGGKLGIAIEGGRRSKARLRTRGSATQRVLEVSIPGEGVGAFSLSWDGDPYPQQLSSAGLGCLNLRADGAIAFRIESFEVRGGCEAQQDAGQSCQPITIEARIYDPSDPTGQRYVASILRRNIPRRGALDIPFSNFIHLGPRGAATFDCVGAFSISVKVEGQRGLTLELGPIETVGKGAERAAIATPVSTVRPPLRPTDTPQPKSTALQPTVVPTHAPREVPTNTPRAAKASPTRVPTLIATLTPPQRDIPTPVEQSTPEPLPQPTAQKVEDPVERGLPEESVFGAVIALPITPTPVEVKRSRRRLWD